MELVYKNADMNDVEVLIDIYNIRTGRNLL